MVHQIVIDSSSLRIVEHMEKFKIIGIVPEHLVKRLANDNSCSCSSISRCPDPRSLVKDVQISDTEVLDATKMRFRIRLILRFYMLHLGSYGHSFMTTFILNKKDL